MHKSLQQSYEPLIGGDWQGKGLGAFQNRMDNEVFPSVDRLKLALTEAQQITNQISQIFHAAEAEAAALFKGGMEGDGSSSGEGKSAPPAPAPKKDDRNLLEKGWDWLKDRGKDVAEGVGDLIDTAKDAAGKAIEAADRLISEALNRLLPLPSKGGKESISVEINGDMTVPGAELGIPASIKIKGLKKATLTRNDDGTYSLTLSNGGGLGLTETTGGAKGEVTVGSKTSGAGAEASGTIMATGEQSVTFKFDPNKPGDMTKMAATAAALGMPGFPQVGVAPAMAVLKDNISSVKVAGGLEGEVTGTLGGGPLLGAGGALSGKGIVSTEIRRTPTGETEIVTTAEVSGKGSADVTVGNKYGRGGQGTFQVQDIYNTSTKSHQAVVSVSVESTKTGTAPEITKYLPKGTSINNLGIENSQKVNVEYTLNQPGQTVIDTFFKNGSPNLDAIKQNSSVKVTATDGGSFTLGGKGGAGVPTQKVEVGAGVTVKRESERVVYEQKGF